MLKRLLLVLVPVLAAIGWLAVRRSAPPVVAFTTVTRETLVSTLTTNGKVEPLEWAAVHAEAGGALSELHVTRGQAVRAGQLLASINVAGANAELSSARSRIEQVQAELETLDKGGSAQQRAEIESTLRRAQADLERAKQEVATLERLVQKNAAPAAELASARESLRRAELEIESMQRRRESLVTESDRRVAQARLGEARSGAEGARLRVASGVVRSPRNGILYALEVRPGDYLQPGQLVARVGRLDQLRVVLYVDEPELGRVGKGMPVTITWDAHPGREWKGEVESLPLQIVPVGTRQVGEVICIIDNPDLSLIPGTNVNAEIRSSVVENALTLPKEALRREGNTNGVFLLDGNRVTWRPVEMGIASITRIEIVSGLQDGDRVALPTDTPLRNGDLVEPATLR